MTSFGKGLFSVFVVILFFFNFELVKDTFSFTGELFLFELLLFLFLGLMVFDSMNEYTKNNRSCFSVLAVYFGLHLLNLIGLALFSTKGFDLSLIGLAGIGFIIAVANMKPKVVVEDEDEEEKKEFDKFEKKIEDDSVDKEEVVLEDIKPLKEGEVLKSYHPGKFLASKNGKKYHAPHCDFAKKIPESSHVWFDDGKSAKKKGYVPCRCI